MATDDRIATLTIASAMRNRWNRSAIRCDHPSAIQTSIVTNTWWLEIWKWNRQKPFKYFVQEVVRICWTFVGETNRHQQHFLHILRWYALRYWASFAWNACTRVPFIYLESDSCIIKCVIIYNTPTANGHPMVNAQHTRTAFDCSTPQSVERACMFIFGWRKAASRRCVTHAQHNTTTYRHTRFRLVDCAPAGRELAVIQYTTATGSGNGSDSLQSSSYYRTIFFIFFINRKIVYGNCHALAARLEGEYRVNQLPISWWLNLWI